MLGVWQVRQGCQRRFGEAIQQGFSIVALLHRANERQSGEGVRYEASQGVGQVFVPGTLSNQPERQIAQGGEVLRGMPGTHPARVFAHAHVANVMQPVFNGPVRAGYGEELCGVGAQAGQAGNRQYDFDGGLPLERTRAGETADLFGTGPMQPRWNLGQGFDGSRFQAAMTLILRRGRLLICLPRHCFPRGKQAHRMRRAALVSSQVGYPSQSESSPRRLR